MDREDNPRSSAGALNSGKDYIRKELETIILYPDELKRGRDVFRNLHASCRFVHFLTLGVQNWKSSRPTKRRSG